jgi:hypothetical protein
MNSDEHIYSKLVKGTEALMDNELRLPKSNDFENTIRSYAELKIARATQIYDYRRWQLHTMGFHDFTANRMVELMYGEKHTRQWTAHQKHNYEWVYNHHTGRNEKYRWFFTPEYYCCEKASNFWHWPPWAMQVAWKCKSTSLNRVCREIPAAVILKILRIQDLNVFNVFHVIESMRVQKSVLLGTLWQLPPSETKNAKIGYVSSFFLSEL